MARDDPKRETKAELDTKRERSNAGLTRGTQLPWGPNSTRSPSGSETRGSEATRRYDRARARHAKMLTMRGPETT